VQSTVEHVTLLIVIPYLEASCHSWLLSCDIVGVWKFMCEPLNFRLCNTWFVFL